MELLLAQALLRLRLLEIHSALHGFRRRFEFQLARRRLESQLAGSGLRACALMVLVLLELLRAPLLVQTQADLVEPLLPLQSRALELYQAGISGIAER